MTYQLEGRMLEVCSCHTVCPCFVGEMPDGGTCDVTVAWHIDKGAIEGVDVAGCTIAAIAHIPGKPLDGGWRAAVYRRSIVLPSRPARPRAVSRSSGPRARVSNPSAGGTGESIAWPVWHTESIHADRGWASLSMGWIVVSRRIRTEPVSVACVVNDPPVPTSIRSTRSASG